MFRNKIDRQIERISASIFGGKDVKKMTYIKST